MTRSTLLTIGSTLVASVIVLSAGVAAADEAVSVSITVKDQQFDPAEIHAPAGKPISISVKNLGSIAIEFESDALHVEKVIPPGSLATVHVRPLEPGRYNFFDDFHHATQGCLVVP